MCLHAEVLRRNKYIYGLQIEDDSKAAGTLGYNKNWGQRKSRAVGNLNDSLLDDERRNLFQHCKMSLGGPKSLGGIPKQSGEQKFETRGRPQKE